MKIGIGLPTSIPGTDGSMIVEWASKAEKNGFSTLTISDRVSYPTYECMVTLAAAAGATKKIGLLTNVLLGPTRNPVLLAKQAASLDRLSNGRFVLGAGIGGRAADYDLVGVNFKKRGALWDEALDLMHKIWLGGHIGGVDQPLAPPPTNGKYVPMLIGGEVDATIERVIRYADGWTSGGDEHGRSKPFIEKLTAAWKAAGKPGKPRLVVSGYFGLGPGADDGISAFIDDYYSFATWGKYIAATVPRTPEALRDTAKKYEDAGFDEVLFSPTIPNLEQIDMLAQALL